jgi:hypothetical protein
MKIALLILICSIGALLEVRGQDTLSSTSVSCDPLTVGVKNAGLSLALQLTLDVPANGSIKITLPPETSITQGNITDACKII